MAKAKKKPLLVKFTEEEHAFLASKANEKGVTMTALVRKFVESNMSKK